MMKLVRNVTALLLCLTVSVNLLTGCQSNSTETGDAGSSAETETAETAEGTALTEESDAAEETNTAENGTYLFTDSAGRQVEVPYSITQIIPSGSLAQTFMWPLASDLLVSLNEAFTEEQLVYIGEAYADLPVTGNLYQNGSELNIEEVASLDAQIIIDFGEAKDSIVEDLDSLQELLGIPCIFIEGSFENTADAYRTLGSLLHMEEEAEEIAQYIESIMNTTAAVFENVEKKTLAFCYTADGVSCIARDTYFDEIWSYMGENVAVVDEAQAYWFSSVSLEQLQIWDPEYLFFYTAEGYETAISDPAWAELQAVKNGNCYTIPQQPVDFCFSPSVNRYIGIIWLAEILYPDEFDWDVEEEIRRYYKLFYDCDLTDELYDALMSGGRTLP